MKLNYITVKNFRQYYGEQTIRFATDAHRHVTVIQGINGAGKTSLLAALNWCLYGGDFFKEDIGEFVSKRAQADAEGGKVLQSIIETASGSTSQVNLGRLDTSVELGFAYQGTQYCARRVHNWLRDRQSTSFSLKKFGDGHPYIDAAATELIQSIVPANVSVHFFFDGEKVENFARPGHEEDVRNAVRNILKIDAVSQGIKHLDSLVAIYRRELRQHATGETEQLHADMDNKQAERDKLDEESKRYQAEVSHAENQKRQIDAQLKANAASRKLADERKEIESNLKQLRVKQKETQRKIRELANRGFISVGQPVLNKALGILRENEVPIGIPESILEDLIHQMRCLCGRDIHDGSPEHQILGNLLKQAVSPELGYAVRETERDVKRLMNQAENIPHALKSFLDEDQRLERLIESKEARVKEIANELEGFNDDEVLSLIEAREEYESEIQNLEDKVHRITNILQKTDADISELDKQLRAQKVIGERAKQIQSCQELAVEVLSAMKGIYNLYEADMRGAVETETQAIFKQLVWKGSQFRDVRLDKNYVLRVIDRYGKEARPEMSAGERQVLSLSFIAAMARVAVSTLLPHTHAEPFPIVMDTPFGKLSTQHRENITATIPNIATQLILFVTDEELHGQARDNLESRIGAEYELQFDDGTGITRIKMLQ